MNFNFLTRKKQNSYGDDNIMLVVLFFMIFGSLFFLEPKPGFSLLKFIGLISCVCGIGYGCYWVYRHIAVTVLV